MQDSYPLRVSSLYTSCASASRPPRPQIGILAALHLKSRDCVMLDERRRRRRSHLTPRVLGVSGTQKVLMRQRRSIELAGRMPALPANRKLAESSAVAGPPFPDNLHRRGLPPSLPQRKASGGRSRKAPDAPWLISYCHPSCRLHPDPRSGPGCRGRRPGSACRGLAGPLRHGLAGSRRARFLAGRRPSWLRPGVIRSGGQHLPRRERLHDGPERVPPSRAALIAAP